MPEDLRAVIARLREKHWLLERFGICGQDHCNQEWPCDTEVVCRALEATLESGGALARHVSVRHASTECTRTHESTTVLNPGWKRTYQPILCSHFDGQAGVVYEDPEHPGEFLVTLYHEGAPGSITQPIDEPLDEQFAQFCESWLLETRSEGSS